MNPQTVKHWVDNKTAMMNDPDFDVAKIDRFIALRRKLIRECQENGVGLLLGCDAPQVFNVPGFSTHNELEYLVLAGLTPYDALRTGTVNVAQYLGRENAGVVRQGAVSDLVLLNANPLEDIKQSRNIAGVMIGEKWMDKAYIDSELKRLVKE